MKILRVRHRKRRYQEKVGQTFLRQSRGVFLNCFPRQHGEFVDETCNFSVKVVLGREFGQ